MDKTVGFRAGRVSVLGQINRPDGLSSGVVLSYGYGFPAGPKITEVWWVVQ